MPTEPDTEFVQSIFIRTGIVHCVFFFRNSIQRCDFIPPIPERAALCLEHLGDHTKCVSLLG